MTKDNKETIRNVLVNGGPAFVQFRRPLQVFRRSLWTVIMDPHFSKDCESPQTYRQILNVVIQSILLAKFIRTCVFFDHRTTKQHRGTKI